MKRYPGIPALADADPELVERGHLWIQELVDGGQLRFQLREDGRLRFGDRDREFRGDPPPTMRYATTHVERSLDRSALRAAVDDVENYVFFGVATHRRGIDYDWDRLPPVLGTDVWNEREGRFLKPDAVEGIFDRLGLDPVDALAKEVNTRDFDPRSYEVPASAWYDGPAKGVVVRNKRGGCGKLLHPSFEGETESAARAFDAADAESLAAEFVTADLVASIRRDLAATDRSVGDDAAFERAFDRVVRAAHPALTRKDGVDPGRLRSAVAARVGHVSGDRS